MISDARSLAKVSFLSPTKSSISPIQPKLSIFSNLDFSNLRQPPNTSINTRKNISQ